MKLSELQLLTAIMTRTSMYIGQDDRSHIIAFFSGYEIGGDSQLLNDISEKLEKRYNCPKRAMGWNGQVEMYATNLGLTWESAFKKIVIEQIIENKTEEESPKIEDFLKSLIKTKISQFQSTYFEETKTEICHFDKSVVRTWLGLVDLNKEWFVNLWSKKQLDIIEKINLEISNSYTGKEIEEINPSDSLIKLSKKFGKEEASP